MKRILYIHQYFKTPQESGAIRSYHIAKGMVKLGYHVDMITSYNGKKYKLEVVEGIMVHYLPIEYKNKFSNLRRSVSFLKFVKNSIALTGKIAKPDLVYATSTPLTVGLIALWLKWKTKVSFIFEVRDLWPEAPIQLGIIKSSILKYLLKKFEKSIYKNAVSLVALSPGIKEGILEIDKSLNVDLIPNMSDVSFFDEKSTDAGQKRAFTIGYFGTFGYANDVNFILKIAKQCMNSNLPIEFLLVGEGSEKNGVESKANEQHLTNIRFSSHVNRFKIKELLSNVDACITTFRSISVLQTSSPNKFFDGLAAAKLMIVNTPGWLQELVESNRCGFYINPKNPKEFEPLILPYLEDSSLLIEAKKNARKLADNQFQKEKLVAQVCDLLPNQ